MAVQPDVLPRLRPIDIRPVMHGGRQAYLLRDPLQISEKVLLVPQMLAPALALCDGAHDSDEIRAFFGLSVASGPDPVGELLDALDNALFLDNARFAEARAQALEVYRAAPFRPMSHAGAVYPADPDELRAMLREYTQASGVKPAAGGRGLFSPHIDYARGGAVYAAVWQRAANVIRDADLVVVLATDHYGDEGSITLTRQHYATPFGVLPTAQGIVDELALAIGPDAAYDGELRNRSEHSIELVAVWLHALRENRPVEVLPILCGSFAGFVRGETEPRNDTTITALLDALARTTAGRNLAIVVSGDLSHVGPAFSGRPLDTAARQRIKAADDALIAQMCAGDAEGFFGAIQRVNDQNNVCGLPPGYLALRTLGSARGELIAYASCPADDDDTSLVSVCGVVFE